MEQSHPAIRPGGCAAFSIDVTDEERLIIVAEAESRYQPEDDRQDRKLDPQAKRNLPPDTEALVRVIRRAVAEEYDVRVHTVSLLKTGSMPRTSSGKLQRRACRAGFLDGTLDRW